MSNPESMQEETAGEETKHEQWLRRCLADADSTIAELRADKERLDWMAKQYIEVRTPHPSGSRMIFTVWPPETEGQNVRILREVIDSARNQDSNNKRGG